MKGLLSPLLTTVLKNVPSKLIPPTIRLSFSIAWAAVAPPRECPNMATLETSSSQPTPGKSFLEMEGRASWSRTNETSFVLTSTAKSMSVSISIPRMVELSGKVTMSASYG